MTNLSIREHGKGVVAYATENNITHKYYQATEDTVDGFLNTIDLAVRNGAKIVVAPGYVFEPAIFKAQDLYPDVHFVLLDGVPQDGNYEEFRTEKNVSAVSYAEEEAGFLAGYAAVKEGYRKLGFIGGMAVPAVIKYGYGYIQGAEYAANELGLQPGDIEVKYTYVGNFEASPENQTLAASWYQGGTEIIFSCGGPVGFSVMAAAEQYDTKVIGVDSDQSADSETVITSAMKMLKNSVYQMLDLFYTDKFPGGETTLLDVTSDGVGLAMENARFTKFTQSDYDSIYGMLVADTDGIASGILTDTDVDSPDELPISIVTVQVIGN
jgi:basic membrane protein A